jgi:hypothetical protein
MVKEGRLERGWVDHLVPGQVAEEEALQAVKIQKNLPQGPRPSPQVISRAI